MLSQSSSLVKYRLAKCHSINRNGTRGKSPHGIRNRTCAFQLQILHFPVKTEDNAQKQKGNQPTFFSSALLFNLVTQ